MITNKNIDHGNGFDWGQTSKDYAKYRDIYPAEFYEKLVSLGLCIKGQTVLDLGTGTGVLPRNMYKYGAKFTGADISENQIAQAKRLSSENNMDIDYIISATEDIDFPDNTFDVVTACQCFMYFNKEIVIPKIHKLLKNNGRFCILSMAWLPFESDIAKKSQDLILKYNPAWTGCNMQRYPINTVDWLSDVFEVEHTVAFDINVSFTRDTWHGRMKACRGIGASSLSVEEIGNWEKEHIQYLRTVPEVFDIIHYATILDVRKRTK